MIPKIIHYVWLGGCEKPKSVKQCIASWKKHCPDYIFMEWNEKNSPLTANEFVRKAYEDKMWAFVSDYIRMFAMDKYGGVYLDTDVNMLESLDSLLDNRFFTGFESEGLPFSGAVFGAEKKHELLRKMLRYYDSTTFVSNHAEKFINTRLVSQLLIDNYGCSKHDSEQRLEDGIHIYPSSILCNPSRRSILVHVRNGSWVSDANLMAKIGISLRKHIKTKMEAAMYAQVKLIQEKVKESIKS